MPSVQYCIMSVVLDHNHIEISIGLELHISKNNNKVTELIIIPNFNQTLEDKLPTPT